LSRIEIVAELRVLRRSRIAKAIPSRAFDAVALVGAAETSAPPKAVVGRWRRLS
jgi:hypothetical protein